jgi:hypothetical protein
MRGLLVGCFSVFTAVSCCAKEESACFTAVNCCAKEERSLFHSSELLCEIFLNEQRGRFSLE